jgi:peptidoglycan/LPS O-acetylase OafA/YrhL
MNSLTTEKVRNYTMDTWRLFASLMVVLLHTGFVGEINSAGTFAKTSVPYFFAITGYFLYRKDYSAQAKSIVKGLFKMLKMFISSYLLIYFVTYLANQYDLPKGGWKPKMDQVNELLFTQKNAIYLLYGVVQGPAGFGVLWFTVAAIGCFLVYWINTKLKQDWLIATIALICYYLPRFFETLTDTIAVEDKVQFALPRFLIDALIFVVVGYTAHKYIDKLERIPVLIPLVALVFLLIVQEEQLFLGGQFHDRYSNYAPLIILCMLLIFNRFPNFGRPHIFWIASFELKYKGLAYFGRLVGFNIYIIHSLIWVYFYENFFHEHFEHAIYGGLATYFTAFFISVVYQYIKKFIFGKLKRLRKK